MSTIKASNIQNGSSSSVNIALNTDGSATFAQMPSPPFYYAMRNKIINGAMQIDQRNGGASVTPTTDTYTTDRWLLRQPSGIFSSQLQTSIVPNNFAFATQYTVASVQGSIAAGTVNNISQFVEAINISDFGWGTPAAKPVTLSFWVRSSITGTYSTSLYNVNFTRAYVATYTISVANTWEFKTITVPGDVSGTWASTTNGLGVAVTFDLGSGSNFNGTAGVWGSGALRTSGSVSLSTNAGATFFLTGVQLEIGSVATPFERRNYQHELAMCYRYYRRYLNSGAQYTAFASGVTGGATQIFRVGMPIDIPMRTSPSVTIVNAIAWNSAIGGGVSITGNYSSPNLIDMDLNTSGLTNTPGLAGKLLLLSNGYIEVGAEI